MPTLIVRLPVSCGIKHGSAPLDNLRLARKIELEWHNLAKLDQELVAADEAGEIVSYRRS